MQQLLTTDQMEKLKKIGMAAQEDESQVPIVRLHLPDKEVYWLFSCIVAGTEQMAYGIFEIGLGSPELGYFDLSEIDELKFEAGVDIVNDLEFVGEHSLIKYAEIAHLKAFQKQGKQFSETPDESNSPLSDKPQP